MDMYIGLFVRTCFRAGKETPLTNNGNNNLIQLLKDAVETDPELKAACGEDFARGHEAATGGSVPVQVWEKLLIALQFDVKKLKSGVSGGSKKQNKGGGDKDNGSKKRKTLFNFGFSTEK
jgi:hypothetical protein